MFIEDFIYNKKFIHYLNLYHYNNLKLLYKSIITEVPFLVINKNKMLSFDNNKKYIKGTISKQLQEYLQEKAFFYKEETKIIDYIRNRDKKYTSNNFYDKFFLINNKEVFLIEYNKGINDKAYLGLYPFQLSTIFMIDSRIAINDKQNIHFLFTCEINPNGLVKIKAFNKKLLIYLLSIITDNTNYKLKYDFDVNKNDFYHILLNLYNELISIDFSYKKDIQKLDDQKIIQQIDKLLIILNDKYKESRYEYKINNKINFLFYENENIINNNLFNFYKKEYIEKYIENKNINDDIINIKLKNNFQNKNIIDFYLKRINSDFTSIDKNIVFKYKKRFINLNNLEEIETNKIEDYSAIIFLINLIYKRLNLKLSYNSFFITNDKGFRKYGADISNIEFDTKIVDIIDIKDEDEKLLKLKYIELKKIINNLSNDTIEDLINLKIDSNEYITNDFFTYCPTYLKNLKEKICFIEEKKTKTFWEKVLGYFFNEETKSFDKKNYDYIKNIEIEEEEAYIKNEILDVKENFYIDLSAFDNFSFNQLKIIYLKYILNLNTNDKLETLYRKRNKIENFIFPIQFSKSNILIDLIQKVGKIDNIIIDKPDNIPLYYLFPFLYNCSYLFILNKEYKRDFTGYWRSFNSNILNSHMNLLKERIIEYLKINNELAKEKDFIKIFSDKFNFKKFTINSQLMSIKDIFTIYLK